MCHPIISTNYKLVNIKGYKYWLIQLFWVIGADENVSWNFQIFSILQRKRLGADCFDVLWMLVIIWWSQWWMNLNNFGSTTKSQAFE